MATIDVQSSRPTPFRMSTETSTDTGIHQDMLPKEKKQKQKKSKQQKPAEKLSKVNTPFYQTLGQTLLQSTKPESKPFPALPTRLPPPPTTTPDTLFVPSETKAGIRSISMTEFSSSKHSLALSRPDTPTRRSEDSTATACSSVSCLSGSTQVEEKHEKPSKYKIKGAVFTLNDFAAMELIESLTLRYGRVAHMGVRDPSYSFWLNKTKTAVVHFKVLNKVAVLGGDPLCNPDRVELTMQEFAVYCKFVGLKIAVNGASKKMAAIAKKKHWTCMGVGTQVVLNPMTNEVLLGKSGKRVATQCRQLIDPTRGGVSIHTYCPSIGRDMVLESELRELYDNWRNERNTTRDVQAYITVFDLFSMNNLMTFLYTKDKEGRVNGMAALRQLEVGYHLDPFIQSSFAPRGVSDLLIFASMAFLNTQGCSHMSIGYEPHREVVEISGMPALLHSTTRKVYRHIFGKIPVGGKETFNSRWKPDTEQEEPLYLVFVNRIPSPRYMFAMTHFSNISLRSIIASDISSLAKKEKKGADSGLDRSDSPSSSTASSSDESEVVKGQ